MAGVTAHSRAIVSSANARVLVTLISVLRFLTTMNKFLLPTDDVSPPWTTTAVTAITAPKTLTGNHRPSSGLRNRIGD